MRHPMQDVEDADANPRKWEKSGPVTFKPDEATRHLVVLAYLRGVNDLGAGDCAADCDDAFQRVWSDLVKNAHSEEPDH
ncbi:MAG: hypothetical protein CMM07_25650 [Rhodopirellula sp.]|nr:hypothetical protein [Rhodopirellula sp.]